MYVKILISHASHRCFCFFHLSRPMANLYKLRCDANIWEKIKLDCRLKGIKNWRIFNNKNQIKRNGRSFVSRLLNFGNTHTVRSILVAESRVVFGMNYSFNFKVCTHGSKIAKHFQKYFIFHLIDNLSLVMIKKRRLSSRKDMRMYRTILSQFYWTPISIDTT